VRINLQTLKHWRGTKEKPMLYIIYRRLMLPSGEAGLSTPASIPLDLPAVLHLLAEFGRIEGAVWEQGGITAPHPFEEGALVQWRISEASGALG
jgi:hypothetical protein